MASVKSFVIRNGRCGAGLNSAYLYGLCHYGLTIPKEMPWCFESLFHRIAPTIVEIGFGMGKSLIEMAIHHPENNYIGIEVHRPGVGQILSEIMRLDLKNLRILPFDAVLAFTHAIPAASLAGIQIYFPDPWPKKRHHKRRLVQTAFVNLLSQSLKKGAYLHLATDWAPYAEDMLEQLAACPHLKNQSEKATYVDKPSWRPKTKFEVRGEGLGHQVFDLLYLKE